MSTKVKKPQMHCSGKHCAVCHPIAGKKVKISTKKPLSMMIDKRVKTV